MVKNDRRKPLMVKGAVAAFLLSSALLTLTLISCSSSSSSLFGGIARVVGQALRPLTTVGQAALGPLANAPITIRDFATGALRDVVAGTTDAAGNFAVDIGAQDVAAVIINGTTNLGPIRISGLVTPGQADITKNLNGVTDIACQAGLDAIAAGAISINQLDPTRILNLETASTDYLQTNTVNFYDISSVNAAVAAVRTRTNEGATATLDDGSDDTDDSGSLNCQTGEFTCNDGTRVCAEVVCNSTSDCPDGSDEDASTCDEDSACCVATSGCPGETATSCADTCCCCPVNQICDQSNFANGCVNVGSGRITDEDLNDPMSKLYITEMYY